MALQRTALAAFLGPEAAAKAPMWASPLRKPHLSLVYGNSPSMLAELAVPPPFVADSVAVWRCAPISLEGVAQWREVARVALCPVVNEKN